MNLNTFSDRWSLATGPVAGSAPDDGNSEESIALQNKNANNETDQDTGQTRAEMLNYNDPAPREDDDQHPPHQPPGETENVTATATAAHPNHAKMWMVLIPGVLSLIVVPGVVLGLVTKEKLAGIGLSGAIGTVAGVIAALYHYH